MSAARGRVSNLLVQLKSELDAFFCLDCAPLPDGTMPRMYYGWEPVEDLKTYGFLHSRDDLEDIRQRLVGNKSAAKAVKCIDSMVSKMDLAGLS